jgi:hypothetical protein
VFPFSSSCVLLWICACIFLSLLFMSSSSMYQSCPYSLALFFVIENMPSTVLSSTLASPLPLLLCPIKEAAWNSCYTSNLLTTSFTLASTGILCCFFFFFFFPCAPLIPLVIFFASRTFFLPSTLRYLFFSLSYCNYFPTCVHFISFFLSSVFSFRFLYEIICLEFSSLRMSVSISVSINFISRLLLSSLDFLACLAEVRIYFA